MSIALLAFPPAHQHADTHAPILGIVPPRCDLLGTLPDDDLDDAVAGERLVGL
jgi:hypothetical protein